MHASSSTASKLGARSKTTVLRVAKDLPDELVKNEAVRKELGADAAGGERITIADAIVIQRRKLENNPSFKPATRYCWEQVFKRSNRDWPELA